MGIWGERNSTNDHVPAPASNPHLLAGPRHLAPSRGTLIALTGCLRERTPSHLAAGLGVGAGLTCPVNARTRLFFLGEDKKMPVSFWMLSQRGDFSLGGSSVPCGMGRKIALIAPGPQRQSPPLAQRGAPLPSACLRSPQVFEGSLSRAGLWSAGAKQDPTCIFRVQRAGGMWTEVRCRHP